VRPAILFWALLLPADFLSQMPNLDFNSHSTLYATHGLHAYAAKCPPPLVRYGLQYYSKPSDLILDPMVGSGTALVESRLMGRNAVGYEIDPLARLIAQVKSKEIGEDEIERAQLHVARRAASDLALLRSSRVPASVRARAIPPDFPNRDYWFDPDVATALTILSHHIGEVKTTNKVRDFLWVAFSSLILARTSVANARDIIHSRHHHFNHPRPPDVLGRFELRVTQMRKQMADFRQLCQTTAVRTTAQARLGDARRLNMSAESVDLVFSSPPYATALDYPRAHFLAVPWMPAVLNVNLAEYRANAPHYVGSQQGKLEGRLVIDNRLSQLDKTCAIITELNETSVRQAKLCHRYFVDMHAVLGEIARVLKDQRHAVIVVCPSHIRRVSVPTNEVFLEMGRSLGLRLKKQHVRTISERRRVMPYMSAFGTRMSTEYVLILQKR
jgi:hypothetical protein